jgi:hypothetical protein
MRVLKSRLAPLVLSGAAALAVLVTPSVLMASQDSDDSRSVARPPCYMGTTFPNPYGRSCTIPGPLHKIRGSAPDANAIIACRGIPGCLSWYVNNP